MPILTPDGKVLTPRIVYCGHSTYGEVGEVFMFRVHADNNDDYGDVFLVAFEMGSPGWTWYVGNVRGGLRCLHNQHNIHKLIYDECDPYDIYEVIGTMESGAPEYDFEEIKYPEKAGRVIDFCFSEGVIKIDENGFFTIHIPKWVDYVEQNRNYMNK